MATALWLDCPDAESLLRYLRRTASERKRRLFAAACCRCAETVLDRRAKRLLGVAERVADGLSSEQERASAEALATQLVEAASAAAEATLDPDVGRWDPDVELANRANSLLAVMLALSPAMTFKTACDAAAAVFFALINMGPGTPSGEALGDRLRELRPPSPRVSMNPSWLVADLGRVRKLAERLYDRRDWDGLPILADALEEAGCTCAVLLGHLRSVGLHTLGCWALDLVLGKR